MEKQWHRKILVELSNECMLTYAAAMGSGAMPPKNIYALKLLLRHFDSKHPPEHVFQDKLERHISPPKVFESTLI